MEKIMAYITNVNDDSTYPKIDDNGPLQQINSQLSQGWAVKSVSSAAGTYSSKKSEPNSSAVAFLTVVVLVRSGNSG